MRTVPFKIVQIAVQSPAAMQSGEASAWLFALDEEGQIWRADMPDRAQVDSLTWDLLPLPIGRELDQEG